MTSLATASDEVKSVDKNKGSLMEQMIGIRDLAEKEPEASTKNVFKMKEINFKEDSVTFDDYVSLSIASQLFPEAAAAWAIIKGIPPSALIFGLLDKALAGHRAQHRKYACVVASADTENVPSGFRINNICNPNIPPINPSGEALAKISSRASLSQLKENPRNQGKNKLNRNKPREIENPAHKNEEIDFSTRIQEYLASLKKASYAFNPPSLIDIAQPVTIFLLLDPSGDTFKVIQSIKNLAPESNARIDSGETKWGPIMEASLSGSSFDMDPSTPVRKSLRENEQAVWAWVITPKQPGEKLPLNLTVKALFPQDSAPPYDVVVLNKHIDVQVTAWWLFDYYFDKYWKWVLGGLATIMAAAFGWWWKKKYE